MILHFHWFLFIVLSLATWRVTRVLALDSIIKEPREALDKALLGDDTYIEKNEEWPINMWRRKALQWLRCPWCMSVWVAAGYLGLWCLVKQDWLGWDFLFVWPAIAGAAMIPYNYLDGDPPCIPNTPCD